jgi:outer membrane protein OmpA-like peptidoglycan-associated protein
MEIFSMKISRKILATMVVASSLGLAACASSGADSIRVQPVSTAVATPNGGTTAVAPATVYNYANDDRSIANQLTSGGVKVVQVENSNNILLLLPYDIRFAPGSAALSPPFQAVLNDVADVMKQYSWTVAQIPGYADSVGSARYNRALGQRRADVVASYLASRGVEPNRLVTHSVGEAQAIASNYYRNGRAANRRVEIVLFAPTTSLTTARR